MYEFTHEEIERINYLYGTDFKEITPDDALLIGKFEANKAMQEEEYKARIKAIKEESEQRLEQNAIQHEAAMSNLKYLHDQAIARLENVENGK